LSEVSEAQPTATALIDSSVRSSEPQTLSEVREAQPAAASTGSLSAQSKKSPGASPGESASKVVDISSSRGSIAAKSSTVVANSARGVESIASSVLSTYKLFLKATYE
jgi:hypothetical protein